MDQRQTYGVKQESEPLSPTYRSHCRPLTGAGLGKCQPGAGATVESMNRTFTPLRRAVSVDIRLTPTNPANVTE